MAILHHCSSDLELWPIVTHVGRLPVSHKSRYLAYNTLAVIRDVHNYKSQTTSFAFNRLNQTICHHASTIYYSHADLPLKWLLRSFNGLSDLKMNKDPRRQLCSVRWNDSEYVHERLRKRYRNQISLITTTLWQKIFKYFAYNSIAHSYLRF